MRSRVTEIRNRYNGHRVQLSDRTTPIRSVSDTEFGLTYWLIGHILAVYTGVGKMRRRMTEIDRMYLDMILSRVLRMGNIRDEGTYQECWRPNGIRYVLYSSSCDLVALSPGHIVAQAGTKCFDHLAKVLISDEACMRCRTLTCCTRMLSHSIDSAFFSETLSSVSGGKTRWFLRETSLLTRG